MSQIKDAGKDGFGARIGALLARRARLLDELAHIDGELLELRSLTARSGSNGETNGAIRDVQWLPLHGHEIARGGFRAPPGLDGSELRTHLDKIIIDERRDGRRVESLEVLIAYRTTSGRVLSVRTRRPGDESWQPRYEANGDSA